MQQTQQGRVLVQRKMEEGELLALFQHGKGLQVQGSHTEPMIQEGKDELELVACLHAADTLLS